MKRAAWRLSLSELPVGKVSKADSSSAEAVVVEKEKVVPAAAKSASGGKNEVGRAVQQLCKLTLQNSSILRQVTSVVFNNAILLGTRACIIASLAAGKHYSAQVKALGKGHGLGSPHLHKGVGFIEGLCEEPEIVEQPLLSRDIKTLSDTLNSQTQSQAELFLSHFKTSEVYNAVKTEPVLVRVEFAFHQFEEVDEAMGSAAIDGASAHKVVMQCLGAIKADIKTGPAPRSNNEREVGAALDRLNKLIK